MLLKQESWGQPRASKVKVKAVLSIKLAAEGSKLDPDMKMPYKDECSHIVNRPKELGH